eukprot:CFRG8361T1
MGEITLLTNTIVVKQADVMDFVENLYSLFFSTLIQAASVILVCVVELEYNTTHSVALALGWILTVIVVFRMVQAPNPTAVQQHLINQFAVDSKGKPGIIGHRGVTKTSPENTLSAIRDAAKAGCTSVEIDLAFTADGVGVLMHDDDVDRTTNWQGRIDRHAYKDVQTMLIMHDYMDGRITERVPQLEEALLLALELDLKVLIDCKSNSRATANLISDLFEQHPAFYDKCIVCSFYPDIIYAVRKINKRVLTGLTYSRTFSAVEPATLTQLVRCLLLTLLDAAWGWYFHNWAWYFLGINCVLLDINMVSKDEVKKWTKRGIPIFVWTVNDVPTMRWLHNHGVSFMTDLPETFHNASNQYISG